MKLVKFCFKMIITLFNLYFVIYGLNNQVNIGNFGIRTVFASVIDRNINITSNPIKYEKDYINVNLDVPLISGNNNLEVQKSINNRIQSTIISVRDNIEKSAKEDADLSKKNGYDVRQYNFSSNYKINYNKDNILSLTLILYQYTGGAHGSTNQITYNFDLNTGKIGVIKDFLGNNKNYRSIILQQVRKQILSQPENYFKETINNLNGIPYDQKFYLDNDGIVIYFDEYEIAPYAAGIPEFKIPYDTFNEGLKKKIEILNDPVNITTDTYINNENKYQSYLSYPVAQNLNNSIVEKKINSTIKKDIFDFDNMVKSMAEKALKNIKSGEASSKWSASTAFKNYFVNEDLMSIVITYSVNNGGTENYMLYDKGYNIDLSTGNLYSLRDVFKYGINYKDLVNKEILLQIKDIEKKYGNKNIYNFKSINDNTQFYIENGNLNITFPSGEIASKEFYNPHFTIPLLKFNGNINEKFIEH